MSVAEGMKHSGTAQTGISLLTAVGVAVAVQISWSINASIGCAAWHRVSGWIDVIDRWIVGVG